MSRIRRHAEQTLALLYQKHGRRLSARVVVAAARPPSSPLHRYFDWADTSAARKWREHQARVLIASVRIKIVVRHVELPTVAYVRDPRARPREQGYTSVVDLRPSRAASRAALHYELRGIVATLTRARDIARALDVVVDLDALIRAAVTLQNRLGKVKAA